MREKISDRELFDQQYELLEFAMSPKNPLALELKAIDQLLDEMPEALARVHADLNRCPDAKGRKAEASAEQVLRSAILMQLRNLPYRQLALEIDSNILYRKFTRFYEKKIPHFTRLNESIKRISPETMERVNEEIVKLGIKKKVEDGKAVRLDTTVSETHIARPNDARLLNDCVRVLDRLLRQLRELAPEIEFEYRNHTRRAKKRAYQIAMDKGRDVERRRRENYEDLFAVLRRVRGYANGALRASQAEPFSIELIKIQAQLKRFLELAEQVHDQAWRRVIHGEKVPSDEKLLSIFETHTDLICRGKKGAKAEFGHKIQFASGRSGMITWYKVLEGNPGDNVDFLPALDYHIEAFGRPPKKVTADRRYYSGENETRALERGVERVALPKPGCLDTVRKSLQKSRWFKRLLRWRAGIEGNLSTLLRSFGLKRCLWKGWQSFKAYTGLSVLTYNLRLLAGHLTQV